MSELTFTAVGVICITATIIMGICSIIEKIHGKDK